MSFIGSGRAGEVYAPGYFLAHEECTRRTTEIPQSMATTASDGSKYVPMGTIFPSLNGNAKGIVYEDVDVSTGNMPGSVVYKGEVYETRLPQATPSYSEASSITSADNPTTKGWYEKDGDTYSASTDTVAVKGKTYYEQGGTSPDYTYTEVDDVEYGDNPKALGLYERSGSSPNYVYTLSTDTQADGSKTYYTFDGNVLSSTVKNALKAAGIVFVDEPTVERPY
jgi:hypothetical protein